jgi:hypothetical protein
MLIAILAVAEPSKVPFYIAGGVLAAWAVVLSAIGLTRPSFPFDDAGARGVMLVTFVIVVATMATAIATSK